jgi:MYXO-CTERM domain-containing protein
VDGLPVESYMASPGCIGIDLPAGRHRVDAIYAATPSKGPLLALGLAVLALAALFRRRLDRPATWVSAPATSARPIFPGVDDA